jgi:aminopeptidase N
MSQARYYDSGGPLTAEQAAYDVLFYDLALAVDPTDSTIDGSLTAVVRVLTSLDHLVFDLDTLLTVGAVHQELAEAGEAALEFEHRGGRVWIQLDETPEAGDILRVRLSYGGAPRIAPSPPWSGGFTWSQTPSGAPWVATTVQQEGPDLWWPSKDHPSDKPDSMALHITVPQPLVVATNGRLLGVDSTGQDATYHSFVSTPISSYNVALNIAPYSRIAETFHSVSGDTFPVIFWVLPEHEAAGRRLLPEILEHMRFFESVAGPYPFRADKYGVAETPHLGMEHQTIIAYGAGFDNAAMTGADWGFDALHHHELSHEWWGNLVTNADWNDMWIHEGFGSYMQPLYLEQIQGESAARAYLASVLPRIGNRAAVAPRESRTAKQIYGNDIYFKGAWVLHTLRYLVGDEGFMHMLRRMAYPDPALELVSDGSHTRITTTDDVLRLMEETTGTELGWFFEVYLRQPKLPRLITRVTSGRLELEWQVPDGLPFPMPVDVRIDGTTHRVTMEQGRGSIALPDGAEVDVDPLNWILREGLR